MNGAVLSAESSLLSQNSLLTGKMNAKLSSPLAALFWVARSQRLFQPDLMIGDLLMLELICLTAQFLSYSSSFHLI